MRVVFLASAITFFSLTAAYADSGIGVGPIKSVKINPTIDQKMVEVGKNFFKMKCSQCHKIEKPYTGPQLLAVTKRRSPEWIMNMILAPQKMIKEDPTAKALQRKLLLEMADQHVSEANARAVLEFFRNNDKALTEKEIKAVKDLSK